MTGQTPSLMVQPYYLYLCSTFFSRKMSLLDNWIVKIELQATITAIAINNMHPRVRQRKAGDHTPAFLWFVWS
jgi:hypothetical protein